MLDDSARLVSGGTMHGTTPLIAGLEMGGTKCVLTLAGGPDIRAQRRIATTDPQATLGAIEDVLAEWRGQFAAIGIAAFGPLELNRAHPNYGSLTATTKQGWTGTDLLRRIERASGVPVAIQTDVNGAALAEGRWGAAQGMRDHAYVTVGTGVGVGVLVGGAPVQGVAHGEAGHMRVPRAPGDISEGICVFHGDCVEGLVSGPALAARFGRDGAAIPDDDPAWDIVLHDLGGLLHNLVVTFAPERIALGGGVFEKRDLFPRLRTKLAASLGGYGALDAYARELDLRLGAPGLGAMAGPLGAVAVGLGALA
jgi:fructokinase